MIIQNITTRSDLAALNTQPTSLQAGLSTTAAVTKAVTVSDSIEISEYSYHRYETTLQTQNIDADLLGISAASDQQTLATTTPTSVSFWADLSAISSFLGLGAGVDELDMLIDLLREDVNRKTTALEDKLAALLDENEIFLAEDESLELALNEKGEITVSGLEDEAKAEKIAAILNEDELFANDFAALRATREVYEVKLSYAAGNPNQTPSLAARRVLLQDRMLKQYGLSLDNIVLQDGQWTTRNGLQNGELQSFLDNEPLLAAELAAVIESEISEPMAVKFTYQRGVLLDAYSESEAAINEKVYSLGTTDIIDHPRATSLLGNGEDNGALHTYNESIGFQPAKRIMGFDFTSKVAGGFEITGKFANGKDLDRKAQNMVESWMSETFVNMVEATSDSLMRRHQAEHGDTKEFAHEVVYHANSYGGVTADVLSEQADEAIGKDIDVQVDLATLAIGGFLSQSDEEKVSPLKLEFTPEGRLRLAPDMSEDMLTPAVKNTLAQLNYALRTDDDQNLPEGLRSALDPLRQIQALRKRIHNPAHKDVSLTIL